MIAVKCMNGCELCWSGALHIKSVSRLKMSIQRHFLLENGNSTMSTVTFAFGKKFHVGSNSGRSRNFVEPGLISQQLRPTANLTPSASPPYDNVRNSLHSKICFVPLSLTLLMLFFAQVHVDFRWRSLAWCPGLLAPRSAHGSNNICWTGLRLSAAGHYIPLRTGMQYPLAKKSPVAVFSNSLCMVADEARLSK